MNALESRIQRIAAALAAAFGADASELRDDSHQHAGHEGARDGRGHFAVRVVSDRFTGLLPLARHRLVYAALGDLMTTDIHALQIKALTPAEAGPENV